MLRHSGQTSDIVAVTETRRAKSSGGSTSKSSKRALHQVRSVYGGKPPKAAAKEEKPMIDIEVAAMASWQAQQAALAQAPLPAAHVDDSDVRSPSVSGPSSFASPSKKGNVKMGGNKHRRQSQTTSDSNDRPPPAEPSEADSVLQHFKGDVVVTEAIKEVRKANMA